MTATAPDLMTTDQVRAMVDAIHDETVRVIEERIRLAAVHDDVVGVYAGLRVLAAEAPTRALARLRDLTADHSLARLVRRAS